MYKQFINKIKHFLELGRYNKLYGAFLLMWPCYWGSLINYPFDLIIIKNLILFFLGSIVMRGAGCTINDLIDAPLDLKVKRTRNRPIASGVLSRKQAIYFLVIQLFFGLLIVINFDFYTILLSLFIIPFVFLYPLVKKFSNYPQLFLGIVFNWGVIISYYALHQSLTIGALSLYFAGIFLTLGYDTIYAFQDIEDDTKHNIGSVAKKIKNHPKLMLTFFYMVSCTLFMISFYFFEINKYIFFSTTILIIFHFFNQIRNFDLTRKEEFLKIFKSNVGLGGMISFCLLLNSIYFF